MATERQIEKWKRADDEVRRKLPPGVKLVRTLRGHEGMIGRIAWSPNGEVLASPSVDGTVRLWDTETGDCIRELRGHQSEVHVVAFDPTGNFLASGGGELRLGPRRPTDTDESLRNEDNLILIWNITTSERPIASETLREAVVALTFNREGTLLISGSYDGSVCFWNPRASLYVVKFGELVEKFRVVLGTTINPRNGSLAITGLSDELEILGPNGGDRLARVATGHGAWTGPAAFNHSGDLMATGGDDNTVKIWDTNSLRCLLTLEGHTAATTCVALSPIANLLASKGREDDCTVRLWNPETGACLATVEAVTSIYWMPGIAFHPTLPLMAVVGSDPGTPSQRDLDAPREILRDRIIHIYELDVDLLLGNPAKPAVSYASAKIVLVGDSGAGKTGLGWRLAHHEFKEHASTHGQQFWLMDSLCTRRADGTECEAVLWDLAGQPDYRLIHALFLDDADLAVVIFDATRNDDVLAGVEFWLKQLKIGNGSGGPPTLLVAARDDRGSAKLTIEELEEFCRQRGIAGYLSTSAMTGARVDELVQLMLSQIQWDAKPATVTTETFKRIKDFVLGLKEADGLDRIVLTPGQLRQALEKHTPGWQFTDDEMLTAVRHLSNHGYVTFLKTTQGEPRILLSPELLNNLAASFVLEARRNDKGLGSLEEQKLLGGGYPFPELDKVREDEKSILLDSAASLFLEHKVCFREIDLIGNAYLVFPELINLKRPVIADEQVMEDGVAYTASGAIENVYASLVVLMGYTQTFTRTNQWRNQARYEVGQGQVCGFRLEEERAGELDLVLYFGADAPEHVRMLFQSLFENFLSRRNLTVRRFEPVVCENGHPLNRSVVRQFISSGADHAFCPKCGSKTRLPNADQPIILTKAQAAEMEAERRAADERSRFEQALFRLKTHMVDTKTEPPECFISYAWGSPEQERWVEHRLAKDLQKAGVAVVLDRWENAKIGASVARFVERVGSCDRVIVVGTPLYRKKYDNDEPMGGFIVAAEGDLIGQRMTGSEEAKESVLPLLREGTIKDSFPYLLQGRVYADFRSEAGYFVSVLDLLLSILEIPPQEPMAIDLRNSIRGHQP